MLHLLAKYYEKIKNYATYFSNRTSVKDLLSDIISLANKLNWFSWNLSNISFSCSIGMFTALPKTLIWF